MAAKSGVWFKYAITAGRFTAIPVSWQGWAFLAFMVTAPLGLALLAAPALRALMGGAGLVVGLLGVFVVVFPSLIVVIRAKGERVQ